MEAILKFGPFFIVFPETILEVVLVSQLESPASSGMGFSNDTRCVGNTDMLLPISYLGFSTAAMWISYESRPELPVLCYWVAEHGAVLFSQCNRVKKTEANRCFRLIARTLCPAHTLKHWAALLWEMFHGTFLKYSPMATFPLFLLRPAVKHKGVDAHDRQYENGCYSLQLYLSTYSPTMPYHCLPCHLTFSPLIPVAHFSEIRGLLTCLSTVLVIAHWVPCASTTSLLTFLNSAL